MYPYVSIDLETTGTKGWCQILEVGAVVEDWKTPVADLPHFHAYILNGDMIYGEPFALQMNAEILRRIAKPKQWPQYKFLDAYDLMPALKEWLAQHDIDPSRVTAAGKNFAGFDRPFLTALDPEAEHVKFHYRCIDPALFYWRPWEEDVPPNTATCLKRAGFPPDVKHTAVEDARQIIELVRAGAPKPPSGSPVGSLSIAA